jgi:hypothetical protein
MTTKDARIFCNQLKKVMLKTIAANEPVTASYGDCFGGSGRGIVFIERSIACNVRSIMRSIRSRKKNP